MSRVEDRAVLVALCARDISSSATPFTAAETWRLLEDLRAREVSPAHLLTEPADDRMAARLAAVDQVETLVERYAEHGVWLLTPFDERFPERLAARLGGAAPVLLYGAGNAELLNDDGIGVVGSRDLDEEATGVTRGLGDAIAAAGRTLVSGGARGADQIAMSAAAARGGSVVGVLVHPLERQVRRSETRRLIEDDRLCLVSPFKPSAGFSAANAMARNKLIYGLTRCTAVVASADGSGGTWAGATEALRRRFGPVAVWSGPGAGVGNRRLIERGARPFTTADELLAITREGFELDQLTMRV